MSINTKKLANVYNLTYNTKMLHHNIYLKDNNHFWFHINNANKDNDNTYSSFGKLELNDDESVNNLCRFNHDILIKDLLQFESEHLSKIDEIIIGEDDNQIIIKYYKDINRFDDQSEDLLKYDTVISKNTLINIKVNSGSETFFHNIFNINDISEVSDDGSTVNDSYSYKSLVGFTDKKILVKNIEVGKTYMIDSIGTTPMSSWIRLGADFSDKKISFNNNLTPSKELVEGNTYVVLDYDNTKIDTIKNITNRIGVKDITRGLKFKDDPDHVNEYKIVDFGDTSAGNWLELGAEPIDNIEVGETYMITNLGNGTFDFSTLGLDEVKIGDVFTITTLNPVISNGVKVIKLGSKFKALTKGEFLYQVCNGKVIKMDDAVDIGKEFVYNGHTDNTDEIVETDFGKAVLFSASRYYCDNQTRRGKMGQSSRIGDRWYKNCEIRMNITNPGIGYEVDTYYNIMYRDNVTKGEWLENDTYFRVKVTQVNSEGGIVNGIIETGYNWESLQQYQRDSSHSMYKWLIGKYEIKLNKNILHKNILQIIPKDEINIIFESKVADDTLITTGLVRDITNPNNDIVISTLSYEIKPSVINPYRFQETEYDEDKKLSKSILKGTKWVFPLTGEHTMATIARDRERSLTGHLSTLSSHINNYNLAKTEMDNLITNYYKTRITPIRTNFKQVSDQEKNLNTTNIYFWKIIDNNYKITVDKSDFPHLTTEEIIVLKTDFTDDSMNVSTNVIYDINENENEDNTKITLIPIDIYSIEEKTGAYSIGQKFKITQIYKENGTAIQEINKDDNKNIIEIVETQYKIDNHLFGAIDKVVKLDSEGNPQINKNDFMKEFYTQKTEKETDTKEPYVAMFLPFLAMALVKDEMELGGQSGQYGNNSQIGSRLHFDYEYEGSRVPQCDDLCTVSKAGTIALSWFLLAIMFSQEPTYVALQFVIAVTLFNVLVPVFLALPRFAYNFEYELHNHFYTRQLDHRHRPFMKTNSRHQTEDILYNRYYTNPYPNVEYGNLYIGIMNIDNTSLEFTSLKTKFIHKELYNSQNSCDKIVEMFEFISPHSIPYPDKAGQTITHTLVNPNVLSINKIESGKKYIVKDIGNTNDIITLSDYINKTTLVSGDEFKCESNPDKHLGTAIVEQVVLEFSIDGYSYDDIDFACDSQEMKSLQYNAYIQNMENDKNLINSVTFNIPYYPDIVKEENFAGNDFIMHDIRFNDEYGRFNTWIKVLKKILKDKYYPLHNYFGYTIGLNNKNKSVYKCEINIPVDNSNFIKIQEQLNKFIENYNTIELKTFYLKYNDFCTNNFNNILSRKRVTLSDNSTRAILNKNNINHNKYYIFYSYKKPIPVNLKFTHIIYNYKDDNTLKIPQYYNGITYSNIIPTTNYHVADSFIVLTLSPKLTDLKQIQKTEYYSIQMDSTIESINIPKFDTYIKNIAEETSITRTVIGKNDDQNDIYTYVFYAKYDGKSIILDDESETDCDILPIVVKKIITDIINNGICDSSKDWSGKKIHNEDAYFGIGSSYSNGYVVSTQQKGLENLDGLKYTSRFGKYSNTKDINVIRRHFKLARPYFSKTYMASNITDGEVSHYNAGQLTKGDYSKYITNITDNDGKHNMLMGTHSNMRLRKNTVYKTYSCDDVDDEFNKYYIDVKTNWRLYFKLFNKLNILKDFDIKFSIDENNTNNSSEQFEYAKCKNDNYSKLQIIYQDDDFISNNNNDSLILTKLYKSVKTDTIIYYSQKFINRINSGSDDTFQTGHSCNPIDVLDCSNQIDVLDCRNSLVTPQVTPQVTTTVEKPWSLYNLLVRVIPIKIDNCTTYIPRLSTKHVITTTRLEKPQNMDKFLIVKYDTEEDIIYDTSSNNCVSCSTIFIDINAFDEISIDSTNIETLDINSIKYIIILTETETENKNFVQIGDTNYPITKFNNDYIIETEYITSIITNLKLSFEYTIKCDEYDISGVTLTSPLKGLIIKTPPVITSTFIQDPRIETVENEGIVEDYNILDENVEDCKINKLIIIISILGGLFLILLICLKLFKK